MSRESMRGRLNDIIGEHESWTIPDPRQKDYLKALTPEKKEMNNNHEKDGNLDVIRQIFLYEYTKGQKPEEEYGVVLKKETVPIDKPLLKQKIMNDNRRMAERRIRDMNIEGKALMSLEITPHGELYNDRYYEVRGHLELLGDEELSNCEKKLSGAFEIEKNIWGWKLTPKFQ